jgi:ubiquinone/menaquinone biosynthesis C-methylase UbiE
MNGNCGMWAPYTTVTFARVVKKQNLMASIDVLDISPYSLGQSRKVLRNCQDIDQTRVCFLEGDALNMPLSGECFDWIETDFFMQYFSLEEKAILFKEWYRVLKSGGIVTTRDWLLQRQNCIERVVDRTKNWLIRHILGPIARSDGLQEVKQALIGVGFEVAFFPVRIPIIHVMLPLMSYIIIYKPDHANLRHGS